jgi:hypothetical protein
MENKAKSVRMVLAENELQQLENLASTEKRSVSNTVSIIVSEYFKNLNLAKENEKEKVNE